MYGSKTIFKFIAGPAIPFDWTIKYARRQIDTAIAR